MFLEIAGASPNPHDALWQRAAVHEAGHAVVLTMQTPGRPPFVALGQNGDANSFVAYMSEHRSPVTSAAVDDLLTVLMAGRAAEEVVMGSVSAGAGGPADSDLAKATALAIRAEISLGLGSSGLVWGPTNDLDRLFHLFAVRPGTEAAIRQRLDESYATAIRIITQMRAAVEALAQTLLGKIVMTQNEVGDVLIPRFIDKVPDGGGRINTH